MPQHVGMAKAYEMILTGEPISGEEAAALGLANHAVDEDSLEEFSMNLAKKFAAKSRAFNQCGYEVNPIQSNLSV